MGSSVIVRDQGALDRRADLSVVPDRGVEREQPLDDPRPQPGGDPAAVAFEAELVLRGGHTLRGFDRLPAEAEITNPRHPLAGRRVPVVEAHRFNGAVWLTVTLPDGYPARIPVDDTDLGTARVAGPGTTVLSVAGIRRLRELAAAMAGRGRDQ
jgi:hypothetical protein